MQLPVSAVTVALLAVLLVVLSLRVIACRRRNRISVGDGGHEELLVMIRGQANLAEYGPIGVLLVLIAELQAGNPILLVLLAALFRARPAGARIRVRLQAGRPDAARRRHARSAMRLKAVLSSGPHKPLDGRSDQR